MRQKVYLYQWRLHIERYLSLEIIPPTIGTYSSNNPEKEQKKIAPKKRKRKSSVNQQWKRGHLYPCDVKTLFTKKCAYKSRLEQDKKVRTTK